MHVNQSEWISFSEAAKESGKHLCYIYALYRLGHLRRYPAPDPGPKGNRCYVLRRSEWLAYLQQSAERKSRGLARLPVGPEWISAGEAAQILGVSASSRNSIYHWLRVGEVRERVEGEYSPWYNREDVLRAAERRKNGLLPPPEGYVWAVEWARERGVSRQAVHQLIVRGRIPALRVGWRWAVAVGGVREGAT